MKKYGLFLFLLPLFASAQNTAPCNVNDYTMKWIALTDYDVWGNPRKDRKPVEEKMKPHLNAALAWVKSKSVQVTGAKEARHYNYFYHGYPGVEKRMDNDWYISTGLISNYYLKINSRGLSCARNRLVTMDGPADMYVRFNHVNNTIIQTIVQQNADGLNIPVLIKGRPVYEIPLLKRSEGSVDYYQYPGPPTADVSNFSKWYFIDTYIIRNSDQPFFIPFTRQEYLEAYLSFMPQAYQLRRNMTLQHTVVQKPEEIDAALQKRIEEIKRLTEQGAWGYSKESMAHRIKVAEEHFRNLKEEEVNKIKNLTKKLDDDYNSTQQFIQAYLKNTPASELKKPVAGSLGGLLAYADFEGGNIESVMKRLETTPDKQPWGSTTQLATINKAYFNPNLPPDVPQVIAVEVENLDNVHTHLNKIVDNINRDYNFSALKALFPKTGFTQR